MRGDEFDIETVRDRDLRPGPHLHDGAEAQGQNHQNPLTLFPGPPPAGERPKPVEPPVIAGAGDGVKGTDQMGYRVAVVGATGNVGREMLNILAERKFPVSEVIALASSRSQGQEISFGDKRLKVQNLENFDFHRRRFRADERRLGASPRNGAKRSARTGCIVVDNSSFWRYHGDVPLVVPEVNAHVLDAYMARNDRKNIIANPNCSTAQLVVALKPLHDFATIKRVVVATYQSVSGRRQGRRRRAVDADQGHLRQRQRRRPRSSPSRSPSTSFRISTSSWKTARPRKSGRWWPRPRRSSTPRSS